MADTVQAIGASQLELVQGDITQESVEAIANAANQHLAGGGGVDGAIHRAGGAGIMQELRSKYPQGCPTGQAVMTGAGALKAKYVIHAVGPRYGGRPEDAELLASAYSTSLELCLEHKIRSIAFPSVSTGIYGYPLRSAAPIAVKTVAQFLKSHPEIERVRFVLFDAKTLAAYQAALAAYREDSP